MRIKTMIRAGQGANAGGANSGGVGGGGSNAKHTGEVEVQVEPPPPPPVYYPPGTRCAGL